MIAVLLMPLGLWARHQHLGPGSVPLLDSSGRSFWLAGAVLTLATALLFQAGRRHPEAARGMTAGEAAGDTQEPVPTAWMLPTVIALSAVFLLEIYHSIVFVLACALGVFVLLAVTDHIRVLLRTSRRHPRPFDRAIYTLLIHVIAFVSLSMVYINKVRSLFSATAVLVLVVLLMLSLTEGENAPFARRLVYAVSAAMVLGQITWVLNYWRATGWTGGAALLIFFYFTAGLMLTQLRGRVTTRDVVEYGVVSVAAFSIVTLTVVS